MKRKFIIAIVVALLFCVVIVNTMADPSGIAPVNHNSNHLVSASQSGMDSSLGKTDNAPIINSNGGNGAALLSMLLVGLALVGLASFREGNEDQGTDRSNSKFQ